MGVVIPRAIPRRKLRREMPARDLEPFGQFEGSTGGRGRGVWNEGATRFGGVQSAPLAAGRFRGHETVGESD